MSASAETTSAWPPADRLSEYVTETGLVDYDRLAAQQSEWLDPVLALVKKTSPDTDADRHAFLINAYNLWTMYWVIRERRSAKFKGATSTLSKARFFHWHKIVVSGKKWNLVDFENKAIRPDFGDARVHFALNCASMSCSPLRRKLFTGPGLDAELDEVTSAAINGGAMVQIKKDGKTVRLNPIFKRYKEDFKKDGGILAFIRSRWTGPPFPEDAKFQYFTYDWRTNNQLEESAKALEVKKLVEARQTENAAFVKVKQESKRLVQKEAKARRAAEMKAAKAAERAEAAVRARQEEDKIKEDARRALQAEAEVLRSKLLEEAQAKARKEVQALREAEQQAEREARLVKDAQREAERKDAADRDANRWENMFRELQRERDEEAQRAKEFEQSKNLALRAAEKRRSLEGANVSYEDVDHREGKSWWQCVFCRP